MRCERCGSRDVWMVEDLIGPKVHCHGCEWDERVEAWPDGAPVVVDTTLEPEDFQ